MIIAEYLVYFLFALFPFLNYHSFLYGGTSFRATILILVASIIGIILAIHLFRKKSILAIPKSPILLVLGLYLVAIIVSALAGLNFETSFWSTAARTTGIWFFLNLGLLIWLLWGMMGDRKKQQRLILIIIFSAAAYSILSFLGREGLGWIFKEYRGNSFTFGNSTFAGMYLFGSFLLSIYYLLQTKRKRWWLYVLPILIIINPNILNNKVWFGDFSHGLVGEAKMSAYTIALSLLGFVVIWAISKIKTLKTKAIISYTLFGVGLLAMVLFVFSLMSADGYFKQVYMSRSSAVRPLTWEMSWVAINERPYFGWGTDNFERVFEVNYDNRILQIGEAWLDRAHNVIVDQLIDNGLIGFGVYVLSYLIVILSLIYVCLNSQEYGDRLLAAVLLVYFPLHFLELQTAFDTTISYLLLAFMVVLAARLYHRTKVAISPNDSQEILITSWGKYSIAIVLIAFTSWSLIWGWIPYVRAQMANGQLRTAGSSEKRIPLYPILLATSIDQHAFLWRTSTDFQRGVSEDPSVLADSMKVENYKKELLILEEGYESYIASNPTHFRARLNLADILIYQRLFEIDKLAEAQKILDEAIALVPQSPQSYWMKAVGYVYMGKFNEAREFARKGLELNPKIEQSQKIVEYVEESIRTFPEIDLFFFSQI